MGGTRTRSRVAIPFRSTSAAFPIRGAMHQPPSPSLVGQTRPSRPRRLQFQPCRARTCVPGRTFFGVNPRSPGPAVAHVPERRTETRFCHPRVCMRCRTTPPGPVLTCFDPLPNLPLVSKIFDITRRGQFVGGEVTASKGRERRRVVHQNPRQIPSVFARPHSSIGLCRDTNWVPAEQSCLPPHLPLSKTWKTARTSYYSSRRRRSPAPVFS